jgi:hypothetical protein
MNFQWNIRPQIMQIQQKTQEMQISENIHAKVKGQADAY